MASLEQRIEEARGNRPSLLLHNTRGDAVVASYIFAGELGEQATGARVNLTGFIRLKQSDEWMPDPLGIRPAEDFLAHPRQGSDDTFHLGITQALPAAEVARLNAWLNNIFDPAPASFSPQPRTRPSGLAERASPSAITSSGPRATLQP